MSTKPIKCTRCKVAVQVTAEPNSQRMVICPRCGLTDTLKNVERELAEIAEEYVADQLDATFKRVASGNKFLTYKPAPRHKRRHRFTVDL